MRDGHPYLLSIGGFLVAIVIAIGVLYHLGNSRLDLNNLALGAETIAVYGAYAGDRVHCGSLDEADKCLEPAERRALPHRIVWIGNSQLHAINQFKTADETAPALLAEALRPKGIEVLGFSIPNGSLAEFYLMFEYLLTRGKIDRLILPIFLDDTRERKIRETLRQASEQPLVAEHLRATPTGREILSLLPQADDGAAGQHFETMQARSEHFLTSLFEACCRLQTIRKAARGKIEITMFVFRNWLFGIQAQTVRKIIRPAYKLNLDAYEQILDLARQHGVQVTAYIPPLRHDVAPPYDTAEYAAFKQQIDSITRAHGATLLNLENLVPDAVWGTKGSTNFEGSEEIDFMHFQGPGHRLVKARIEDEIERE